MIPQREMEPTSRSAAQRSRRPIAVGLAISAALHLLAFLLYPGARDDLPSALLATSSPASPAASDAMRAVQLAPFDESRIDRTPEEPVETLDPVISDLPPLERLFEEDAPSALEAPPLSAAERLRTSLTVPELWIPLTDDALALPVEARERLVMGARIAEWYDSLALAAEAEAALTDWTYTDSEGKRWGAADGMIYLGDFAIPVPFGFGVSNARREEVAERMWQWDELMRQGVRVELIEAWEERQEAIRRRRDRERAARADSGGVGW